MATNSENFFCKNLSTDITDVDDSSLLYRRTDAEKKLRDADSILEDIGFVVFLNFFAWKIIFVSEKKLFFFFLLIVQINNSFFFFFSFNLTITVMCLQKKKPFIVV